MDTLIEKTDFTSAKRDFIADALIYLLARIVPAFLGFFSTAVYTRLVYPYEYGNYALVVATSTLTMDSLIAWTWTSGFRYFQRYSSDEIKRRQFLSSLIFSFAIWTFFVFLVWSILLIFFSKFVSPEKVYLFFLGGLLLVAKSALMLALELARASFSTLKYSLISLSRPVLSLLFGVGLVIFFGMGAGGMLLGLILGFGIIGFADILIWIRKGSLSIFYVSSNIVRELIRYGVPFSMTLLFSFILRASDRFMINYFVGPEPLGLYSAVYDLVESAILLFFGIIAIPAYPYLTLMYERGRIDELTRLMRLVAAGYIVIVMPVVIIASIKAGSLTALLLGARFKEGYIYVPWVAVGGFFLGLMSCHFNRILQLAEKVRLMLMLMIIVSIFNVALNLYLIPKFGAMGAAYSTTLSYLLGFLATGLYARREILVLWPWHSTFVALFGSVVIVLALSFTDGWRETAIFLFGKIGLAMTLYVIVLWLCKEKFMRALGEWIRAKRLFKETS